MLFYGKRFQIRSGKSDDGLTVGHWFERTDRICPCVGGLHGRRSSPDKVPSHSHRLRGPPKLLSERRQTRPANNLTVANSDGDLPSIPL